MDYTLASKLFAALFAIMNPLTNLPVFLALTADKSGANRATIALTGAVAAFGILVVALLAGERILSFFGITVDDFRISGGLLILLIALSMLHVQTSRIHHAPEEADEARGQDNPGLFPLAIPLLAGPGSIATVIVFAHQTRGVADTVLSAAVIFAVCAMIYGTFAVGGRIGDWLGATGLNVVTRIMGMLLAAIAIGMIVDGLTGAFPAFKG